MKQEYQDRIDLYVLGKMTEEERKAFEEDMSKDAELKEQTEFTKSVCKVVKSRSEKQEKMKGFEKGYEDNADEKETVAPKRNKFKFIYWASSIAAVLVVGFFVMKRLNTSYDSLTFPIELEYGTVRGGGMDDDYADIQKMVDGGECEKALAEIKNQLKKNNDELLSLLKDTIIVEDIKADSAYNINVKTVCLNNLNLEALKKLIETDKSEKALDEIDSQLDINNNAIVSLQNDTTLSEEDKGIEIFRISEYIEDLTWLKVHALIRLKKTDEAKKMLDEISGQDGKYKEKADTLKNKI